MNSLTKDFSDFISKISLNENELNDIQSKHTTLTDMIKKDPPKGYKIKKTILSGSYAKKTVINEYDKNSKPDVDIILLIEKPIYKNVDDIYDDFLNYYVEKKGKVVSTIRQQSNSIGLEYVNIGVDLVIGCQIDDKDTIEIISRKKHDWIKSNSIKHTKFMKKQNEKFEGFSYYSLMKLFKYLNKEVLCNPIKSYTLEQLVHQCCPEPVAGLTLWQAFSQTLDNISGILSIYEIRDCCDILKNGFDEKDIDKFGDFNKEIKRYSVLSKEAINGDRKKWETIFGERFPKQPDNIIKNRGVYDESQTPWRNN